MWILFKSDVQFAIKIYVGGVNAVSGEPSEENMATRLRRQKRSLEGQSLQDYVVTPQQRWLDGIATAEGKVRQFVAIQAGLGYTVEAQITGKETTAGLQFEVTRKKYVLDKSVDIRSPQGLLTNVKADPDMLINEFIDIVEKATSMSLGRKRIYTDDPKTGWESLEAIDLRDDPLERDYARPLKHYNLASRDVGFLPMNDTI